MRPCNGSLTYDILQHLQQFSGDLWYVNDLLGDDTNDGRTSETPFETITAAMSAVSEGDGVVIANGTYSAEVTIDVANIHFFMDPNAIITDEINVTSEFFTMIGGTIEPSTGSALALVGSGATIVDVKIRNGTCTNAVGIGSTYNTLIDVYAEGYSTNAYLFSSTSTKNRLINCVAMGAGGSTTGFNIGHADAELNYFENCHSYGNGTAGWTIISGATTNSIVNCSSGKGDGPRTDPNIFNSWVNFKHPEEQIAVTTFSGDGPSSDNLFTINGVVRIKEIYGVVTTALSADAGGVYLELFPSGGGAIELTKGVASGGVDVSSAPVGSLVIKVDVRTTEATYEASTNGFVWESTDWVNNYPFILGKHDGEVTVIRLIYAGTATSGAITWHVKWEPMSSDGWVEA